MGKFIDGLYYRNDQVEPDGRGGWRVRATPFDAIIEIVAEDTGAGVPEPEPEAPSVDALADEPVVVSDAEPATEAKDEDPSIPGPTPPSAYETKVVAAKPKPKPGAVRGGDYDTKD